MRGIAFWTAVTIALLVPAQGWTQIKVLKADCASYRTTDPLSPFEATSMLAPHFPFPQDKNKMVCHPSKADLSEVSDLVYTKKDIDEQMNKLQSGLQVVLNDAVFQAAVKFDQMDELENEMWRRLRARYPAELQELNQQIEGMKAKLKDLETRIPAAAPTETKP